MNLEEGSDKSFHTEPPYRKREVLIVFQMVVIFIIIVTCLVNLTFSSINEKEKELWSSLLMCTLCVLLPTPLRTNRKNV